MFKRYQKPPSDATRPSNPAIPKESTASSKPTVGRARSKDGTKPPEREKWFSKYADAGFRKYVIPVIPPSAKLSPHSNLNVVHLGKIPGKRKTDGTWAGYHNWTDLKTTPAKIERWDSWGDASVGMRTGEIVGVDIDIMHDGLADKVERLTRSILGDARVRIGQAPKRLLVYRTPTPMNKIVVDYLHSATDDEQKLEILGDGQQFVVEGIHPKTGKPYTWPRGRMTSFDNLTEITQDQINKYVNAVTTLMADTGYDVKSAQRSSGTSGRQLIIGHQELMGDPDLVRKALQLLGNSYDRDKWVGMCYAVKAALGGLEEYYSIFEDWCLIYDRNTQAVARKMWDSIKNSSVGFDYVMLAAEKIAVEKDDVSFLERYENHPRPWIIDEFDVVPELPEDVNTVCYLETRQHITDELRALGFKSMPVFWHSIKKAERRSYVNGNGQRFIISEDGAQVAIVKDIAVKILTQEFGQFINGQVVSEFIERNAERFPTPAKVTAFHKLVINTIIDGFWATVARNKTVGTLQIQVNMFASRIETNISRDVGTITLPFNGLRGVGVADDECVNDFKDHAPEFDAIIQFILYSRFTSNPKTSYLWLHCDSDWGKGFLFNSSGVFGGLGIVQEISVKEVEAAMEGKPVGVSRLSMIDQWVLVVDEFKHVRSEIKQLDNVLTASPKYEMRFTAPLYAKVFLSAETVGSLVGEAGVEAQFARRFSYMRGRGSLEKRPVFENKGGRVYVDGVREYARGVLEEGVKRLTAIGVQDAAKEADEWLRAFHDEHGIGKQHASLNDAIIEIAKDIADAIIRVCEYILDNPGDALNRAFDECLHGVPGEFERLLKTCIKVVTWNDEEVCLISRLSKLCGAWVYETFDKSEAVKVSFKRGEITTLVDQHLFPDRPSETTKVRTDAHPQGKVVRGAIYSRLTHL